MQIDITKHWSILLTAATIVGTGYLSIYRLNQAEAQIAKVREDVEAAIKKEHDLQAVTNAQTQDTIRAIKDSLGIIQLDMAVVCTELVRERGGNPMIECRTTAR